MALVSASGSLPREHETASAKLSVMTRRRARCAALLFLALWESGRSADVASLGREGFEDSVRHGKSDARWDPAPSSRVIGGRVRGDSDTVWLVANDEPPFERKEVYLGPKRRLSGALLWGPADDADIVDPVNDPTGSDPVNRVRASVARTRGEYADRLRFMANVATGLPGLTNALAARALGRMRPRRGRSCLGAVCLCALSGRA
jgi:hypothetical protein